jgi:hypothetical protein
MSGTEAENGTDRARKERMAFLNRETAEVYLLLDFLSGRADRSLRPTQEERARTLLDQQNHPNTNNTNEDQWRAAIEDDLSEPTRLVLRTMRIQYPLEQENPLFQADAAFLMRARDVLNTRASPATGATIAFTSLVAASSHGRQPSEQLADFAERAYPQYRTSARALAGSVTWMLRGLMVVLILALAASGYTAWGKVMLDTLDAIRRDDGATQQELAAARSQLPASQASMACGDHCTDSIAKTVSLTALAVCGDRNPNVPAVCDRVHDIQIRRVVTTYELAMWEFPSWFPWWFEKAAPGNGAPKADVDAMEQKRAEQWAVATMAVLGNYVMPILYGLLGSIAYVLRRHYDRLAAHLLSPRDVRANRIRLMLGVLIGGCVGLIFSGSSTAQSTGILGAAATLSTSAIAFLAGYGVEGVFKALDGLITQVFRVNGTERQPPATAPL